MGTWCHTVKCTIFSHLYRSANCYNAKIEILHIRRLMKKTSDGYCETGTSFFPFLLCFATAAAPSCIANINKLMFNCKNDLIIFIRVRTVHKKTDWTQYPILRPQFRPTQGPIRFTVRTHWITRALTRSPENVV